MVIHINLLAACKFQWSLQNLTVTSQKTYDNLESESPYVRDTASLSYNISMLGDTLLI